MEKNERCLSCSDCGLYHCDKQDKHYPEFCPTVATSEEELREIGEIYMHDPVDSVVFRAAAEVEGETYGKITRVEEVVRFAKKIGAKKIGVVSCMGLINEAKTFTKVLQANGLDYVCIACKAGAQDKSKYGIEEEGKIHPGNYEASCNPILQARIMNRAKTDLNVIIGLCVGHDSLFMKHSDAIVTTLVAKDRVLLHNPAAALYGSGFYFRRILQEIK